MYSGSILLENLPSTKRAMTTSHPIDNAARALGTSLEGLGALLGVTKGAVSQWKDEGRSVPIIHCVSIERETGGAVSGHDFLQ